MRMRRLDELASGFVAVLFSLGLAFAIARPALALSVTPEEIANFDELMGVAWLSCDFQLVTANPDEVLERIAFDPETNAVRLVMIPRDPEGHDLSPLDKFTLVFDSAKSRAHVLPGATAGLSDDADPGHAATDVYIQYLEPLNIGALQVVSWFAADMTAALSSVTVFPSRTPDGAFVAFQTVSVNLSVYVLEGRCIDEVGAGQKPMAERIRRSLETE
jgi:hypothetical protein